VKKALVTYILFFIFVGAVQSDDLANILQDLAMQTACLGRYSTAQTGVRVTSRYDDPLDWYDPPMMANRFAKMSGNMTRITTFYGVCFDYAQFAWDDIKQYQSMYNKKGMKGQQWYIAVTNVGDPYTIILYDPASREKADIISNGVYLKQNSRHKVYAHDGADGHAWLWVQHNNGTWYWIDPTWTDNTGYVWWGKVENGREVKYNPDPNYCVASNYPRQGSSGVSSKTSSTPNTPSRPSTPSTASNDFAFLPYFLFGYNYVGSLELSNSSIELGDSKLPLGITMGLNFLYFSINIGGDDNRGNGLTTEWILGYSIPLSNFLLLPIGLGANSIGPDDNREYKFVMEIGLMPVLFDFLYFSATYRLTSFKKSSFTLGTGIIF
jgi:hypothetical protein